MIEKQVLLKTKNLFIGVFYWNQFADEGEVKDAAAKIMTSAQ
jgi:hypothetical protein